MKFEDETTNELLNYATVGQEFNKKITQIKDALFDYLKWFEIGPKIHWDQTKDDKTAITYIVMMADVLSYLRCCRPGMGNTRHPGIRLCIQYISA